MSQSQLIFLGTGCSSSIPNVDCLTALSSPDREPCLTCKSALNSEGRKNHRRNTSAIIRVPSPEQPNRTIVIAIDCGKNFQAAAVEHFPRHGLRNIDALLLTHAHADASGGLDDLRGWTLNGAIQDHIDIYTSQATFTEIQRSFPYLVSKEYATGGGDVPEFIWHIIEENVSFEILDTGIMITPVKVHHGRIFSTPPHMQSYLTPPATQPSSPAKKPISMPIELKDTLAIVPLEQPVTQPTAIIQPYICFGFKIQQEILYLSDISRIPDETWQIINSPGSDKLRILVLDCLSLGKHPSHLSLEQSYEMARKIGAERTYLTGFSHDLLHEELVNIAKTVESGAEVRAEMTQNEVEGVRLARQGCDGQSPGWVRPAHDGLRVSIESKGVIVDETYQ